MSNKAFEKNPQVMSTELPDGGSVLLDLSSELYFGLNAVGTRIWSHLGDGSSPDEIVDLLDAHYSDVDRATLENDVTALLAELQQRSLVVPSGAQR